MNQVQTVVNYWMVNTSYSVGVSDTVADASTINTIQATLDEAKKKVCPNKYFPFLSFPCLSMYHLVSSPLLSSYPLLP